MQNGNLRIDVFFKTRHNFIEAGLHVDFLHGNTYDLYVIHDSRRYSPEQFLQLHDHNSEQAWAGDLLCRNQHGDFIPVFHWLAHHGVQGFTPGSYSPAVEELAYRMDAAVRQREERANAAMLVRMMNYSSPDDADSRESLVRSFTSSMHAPCDRSNSKFTTRVLLKDVLRYFERGLRQLSCESAWILAGGAKSMLAKRNYPATRREDTASSAKWTRALEKLRKCAAQELDIFVMRADLKMVYADVIKFDTVWDNDADHPMLPVYLTLPPNVHGFSDGPYYLYLERYVENESLMLMLEDTPPDRRAATAHDLPYWGFTARRSDRERAHDLEAAESPAVTFRR